MLRALSLWYLPSADTVVVDGDTFYNFRTAAEFRNAASFLQVWYSGLYAGAWCACVNNWFRCVAVAQRVPKVRMASCCKLELPLSDVCGCPVSSSSCSSAPTSRGSPWSQTRCTIQQAAFRASSLSSWLYSVRWVCCGDKHRPVQVHSQRLLGVECNVTDGCMRGLQVHCQGCCLC